MQNYNYHINTASLYYPFGMLMPQRNWPGNSTVNGGYRFGMNGQEKDDEITGQTGSHTTAMFWEYDTRIIRRWNLDPKPNPSISRYNCFNGNPIMFVDILGDSARAKISRSMRKELGISRQEAKNYTPEKVAKVFEQEYGMKVEINNGWMHYTGESKNQPTSFSSSAKEMWKKELGDNYKSKEIIVFTNKGQNENAYLRKSFINLSLFDENLNHTAPINGRNFTYSDPKDPNLLRAYNLGRVMEHEILGHSVLEYDDFDRENNVYYGKSEYYRTDQTTVRLVNKFVVEMGLQNYQRLCYGVQDQPMILFGNPDKENSPVFIISYFK